MWAVPGFKDTLLRCFLELEVSDGTAKEFFEGVQARDGQSRCDEGRECCPGLPRTVSLSVWCSLVTQGSRAAVAVSRRI